MLKSVTYKINKYFYYSKISLIYDYLPNNLLINKIPLTENSVFKKIIKFTEMV